MGVFKTGITALSPPATVAVRTRKPRTLARIGSSFHDPRHRTSLRRRDRCLQIPHNDWRGPCGPHRGAFDVRRDRPGDVLAILQRGHDSAIVNIYTLGGHTYPASDFHALLMTTRGRRPSRHLPVADIAIRCRYELHVMTEFGPLHGYARAPIFGV